MVNKRKQSGVVLLVSLVFLIALTAVAAALMQNTTTDIKMSGATQDKMVASQEALGSVDEVIFKQVTQSGGDNGFARNTMEYIRDSNNDGEPDGVPVTVSASDTTAVISLATPNPVEAQCPHSRSASSVQLFSCNVLSIRVERKYGRKNNQEIGVNAGISQQLLNLGR